MVGGEQMVIVWIEPTDSRTEIRHCDNWDNTTLTIQFKNPTKTKNKVASFELCYSLTSQNRKLYTDCVSDVWSQLPNLLVNDDLFWNVHFSHECTHYWYRLLQDHGKHECMFRFCFQLALQEICVIYISVMVFKINCFFSVLLTFIYLKIIWD